MRTSSIAAMFVLLAFITGCAPWATYPPVENAAIAQPTYEPIPTLFAEAISYASHQFGGKRAFAINLPEGVPPKVYAEVFAKVGAGRPMQESSEWAYHITEVRTRGIDGEVDLLYPRDDGLHQLVTIYFKKNLVDGYRVDRSRVWRVHREAPLPNYVPPAVEDKGQLSRIVVEPE